MIRKYSVKKLFQGKFLIVLGHGSPSLLHCLLSGVLLPHTAHLAALSFTFIPACWDIMAEGEVPEITISPICWKLISTLNTTHVRIKSETHSHGQSLKTSFHLSYRHWEINRAVGITCCSEFLNSFCSAVTALESWPTAMESQK